MRLVDCASRIRGKNAGPYDLTFDLFFPDGPTYEAVLAAGGLTSTAIAELYQVPAEDVRIFQLPDILALKVTIPRTVPAGSPPDTDIYGAQAHVLLYDLQVTDGCLGIHEGRRDG